MRKEMLKKSIGTIVMTIALVGTSIPGVTVSPVKVNADVATTVSVSSNEVGKLESIFTTIDLMDASISELETAMEKRRTYCRAVSTDVYRQNKCIR